MEDDEVGAGPSVGMKPQFFYSSTRARRSRFAPLEDADEMFAQLDNGNLSDVGDTDDEEDEDLIVEEAGSDDCVLETREPSDESDGEQTCKVRSWCRKAFEKPSTDFSGVCDENEPLLGKLDIKQYVKGKPKPWGVKVYMLCGASGIIYDFLIYQGSTTCLNPDQKKEFGVTGALVLHFTSRIPDGLGHKMFFDNFFTYLPVIRELDKKKIYAVGTIRINRTQKCPLKSEKELKKRRKRVP
ncbi:hypothetical protein MTO96_046927 [Rhipicephalus appendiculatus]